MIQSTLRKFVFLSLSLGLLFAALPAYATTATGSQNPDLTVSVSYEPTCVTYGQTLHRAYSIKNTTSKTLVVEYEWKVTLNGQPYYEYPWRPRNHNKIQISPGDSWGDPGSDWPIGTNYTKGTYAITLSATDKRGTSSATAQFDIYETTCSLGP